MRPSVTNSTGTNAKRAVFVGLKGLANGELIAAAQDRGFDVLITVDQDMPHQQSIANRSISIVVLRARTTNIDDLLPLMPDVLAALELIGPGNVIRVGLP